LFFWGGGGGLCVCLMSLDSLLMHRLDVIDIFATLIYFLNRKMSLSMLVVEHGDSWSL
jgi:hypothetical protein